MSGDQRKVDITLKKKYISLGFEHCWKQVVAMSVHHSTKYMVYSFSIVTYIQGDNFFAWAKKIRGKNCLNVLQPFG